MCLMSCYFPQNSRLIQWIKHMRQVCDFASIVKALEKRPELHKSSKLQQIIAQIGGNMYQELE